MDTNGNQQSSNTATTPNTTLHSDNYQLTMSEPKPYRREQVLVAVGIRDVSGRVEVHFERVRLRGGGNRVQRPEGRL